MRKAHYWKSSNRASTPSNMLVVDVETWHGDKAKCVGGELHTLRLGCALAYRLDKGERTREHRLLFTTAEQFWLFAGSRLDKRRPLWIWAHNANYDLGILNAWSIICSPEFATDKAALSNTMVWITGQWRGFPITFCDTMNYYHSSLASVGKAVGLDKMVMPEQGQPDHIWAAYCWNDVEITALAIDSLCRFTREQELGPWGPSIASLAFSGYRTKYMSHKVLVHADRDVLKMERESYHGGIVATNYIGRVPASPVYEVDVCSMFPAMALKPLPVKLLGSSRKMSSTRLLEMSKEVMLCANVRLETQKETYPVVTPKGTYYPTGSYTTSLAHPELLQALRLGLVRWVNYCSWYTKGTIFKRYMSDFVRLKSSYRSGGNEAFATLCKYYANNLYGKTGQQSPVWREWSADTLTLIEEQRGLPTGCLSSLAHPVPDLHMREETIGYLDLDVILKVRNYWGVVEVQCEPTESRDSCPIIAATITSYARLLLRNLQDVCGGKHWYYSDTDSLWVDSVGLHNLRNKNWLADDAIGKLSLVREHQYLIVHGNKDYETDSVTKLKGIRARAVKGADGRYTQEHFPSAAAQMRRGPDGKLFVQSITKRLARTVDRCHVNADGFTRPLVFPDEMRT
jgi:hypothetical protein